jgi:hypothetical protein
MRHIVGSTIAPLDAKPVTIGHPVQPSTSDNPSLCVCLGLEAYQGLSDAIASDDLDVEACRVAPPRLLRSLPCDNLSTLFAMQQYRPERRADAGVLQRSAIRSDSSCATLSIAPVS